MLKFANLKPYLTQIPAESVDYPVAQSLLDKMANLDIATTGSGDTGQETSGNVNHQSNEEETVNVSGNDIRDQQGTQSSTPGLEEALMEPAFNEFKVEAAEKEKKQIKVSSVWEQLKAKYQQR